MKHGKKKTGGKTDISFVTNRHLTNLVWEPIFPLSQFEHIFCFGHQYVFYAQICPFEEEKSSLYLFMQLF